jgi:hypothetical protein
MNKLKLFALKATILSMVIVFSAITSAFGRGHHIPEDEIPWGIQGTIGRGYDPADDAYLAGESAGAEALDSWNRNASATRGYFVAPRSFSTRRGLRPYRTNRYYAPGDGYRYPLYYNPATRTYFYYPVQR